MPHVFSGVLIYSSFGGEGLPFFRKMDGLRIRLEHVDLPLQYAPFRHRQDLRLYTAVHSGRRPQLDVFGGDDIPLELSLQDHIRGVDVAVYASLFIDTHKAVTAGVAFEPAKDADAFSSGDLALEDTPGSYAGVIVRCPVYHAPVMSGPAV
jgi:hypothetical protein